MKKYDGQDLGYGWNKCRFEIIDTAGLGTACRINKLMKVMNEKTCAE